MELYFSDVFKVPETSIDKYGAFNISLITDLPLFIDPFLLFNSQKQSYRRLHDNIIEYLRFLCSKSSPGRVDDGLLQAWFFFPEVKQNWFGFTTEGNKGRGLGYDFAKALNRNLGRLFSSFGQESISHGTHLEKLTIIKSGVGRDTISDFTTNLIKEYLLKYTQEFAEQHIDPKLTAKFAVEKAHFNYITETWERDFYTLPIFGSDYVLLTPKDVLTKDNTWINRNDYLSGFYEIPNSIPNEQLRAQINNYLISILPKEPTKKDFDKAATEVTLEFPVLIDYYIKTKEDNGYIAEERSLEKVFNSRQLYIKQFGSLINLLASSTPFYALMGDTATEAYQRIMYLKDVIENKAGWRAFYIKDQPIRREEDLHIFFRLTWIGSASDVSHEVNDGRGSADFKISRGSLDKTIVEFKLASNPQLKRNLQHQVDLYKQASDAAVGYKVIIYFIDDELERVQEILKELDLTHGENVIMIDARKKLSASRVA